MNNEDEIQFGIREDEVSGVISAVTQGIIHNNGEPNGDTDYLNFMTPDID